ncbi:terminase gpA endonuclease subunit, partial [Escherichia coli]|uniref:terminase gpA endonuclease subunit n=1 Tax=Escherichia coli TaxID=562 RepID=UPI001F4BC714
WLPTDGDAENFMKTHVEPTIRDIPSLLALAPWYGKKHRDNTLTMKRFTNGRGFWCTCQIERAASESPHFMRFHVACPHCGEEQYLKFGDKDTPFGLKWTPDDPSSVFYLCEHNACVIRQQELDFTTWVQIVKDWMKTKGDTGKRKTFVNTTLGETWEAKIGERPDAEVMAER